MSIPSINRFKLIAIFCQVIDRGSMRAAAESLGMTPSAVSQYITQLESELEVALIYRSTRKLSLSEAGTRYYQHGKKMLMAAEDAEDAVYEVKHSLEGDIRISATAGIASRPLAQSLKGIMESNSGLSITVIANDRSIDLVAEHIDIAIRVGKPEESSFIFHSLGSISKSIYASPNYLKKYGNPVTPEELKNHFWLRHLTQGSFSKIHLTQSNKETFQYQPKHRMRFNDINALASHVQAGFGMAILPDLEVQHLTKAGILVKVLPEWKLDSLPLYALTISRKKSYKVKAVLKALKEYFV